jgi:hypothetical protein
MLLELASAVVVSIVRAVVLVEALGYLWHRFAEHLGSLGNTIRYRHWVHHEHDYPVDGLRPSGRRAYRQPCNDGILFFGMDRLFGTLREDFPERRQNIFPGYRP